MKCPVCKKDGISDTRKTCPNCQSDLEAFHLMGSVKKSFRQRLYFSVIASALFVVVLLVWIVSEVAAKAPETTKLSTPAVNEEVMQKQSLMEQENLKLKTENEALSKKIAELQKEPEKRQKFYEVQYGESLFTIARKVYGNGYLYEDLAKDNNITNPEQIRVGRKLVIYY